MARKPLGSFGMEMECLVASRPAAAAPVNIPDRFRNSPGRPVLVPEDEEDIFAIQAHIRTTIRAAVEGHVGDRVVSLDQNIEQDPDLWHLRNYRDWVVDRDYSVEMPNDIRKEPHVARYNWLDIEIKSPALWATEKSFAEVHRVLSAVAQTYMMFAPPSAGLHVHIGRGADYIPADHLRRIGAFLYAADPILAEMHPEHRRAWHIYYQSNRNYSVLAHGISKESVGTYIHREDVEVEPDTPGHRPDPEVESRRDLERPDFECLFRRGDLQGYVLNHDGFRSTDHPYMVREGQPRLPGAQVLRPIDIPVAARELFSTVNAPTVSLLMQARTFHNMAYNFTGYDAIRYKKMVLTPDGLPSKLYQQKRTIEFRQPAGTVDPDEILAHIKICLRLIDYASTTPLDDIWKLILDLTQAEVHGDWYDVFDLLSELDLLEEAQVIQKQMAKDRGVDIPEDASITIIRQASSRRPLSRLLSLIPVRWPHRQRGPRHRPSTWVTVANSLTPGMTSEMASQGIPWFLIM
ncbi:putative amidoligase enzyme-domain-containing protein [Hypoxylon crocopeplum]|nr:putative amidoligase enzyme-domain-containing protein [Hypoxylon crocopeplum]